MGEFPGNNVGVYERVPRRSKPIDEVSSVDIVISSETNETQFYNVVNPNM